MTKTTRGVFIQGTSDDIDAVVLDGWRLPEWYTGIERVEVDDVYPEPGGRVNIHYKAGPAVFDLHLTVLELDRGKHMLYTLEGMMKGRERWTHNPQADGVWLECESEYELPGGGLGKIADKLVLERTITQNLEKSLENVKTLVEKHVPV